MVRFALAILRAEPRSLRLPLDRPIPPVARSRHRAQIPRRDPAQGRTQSGALLLHVRAEILLGEDCGRRSGIYLRPGRQREGGALSRCSEARDGGDVGEIPADGQPSLC
jgi:hypothetical protein